MNQNQNQNHSNKNKKKKQDRNACEICGKKIPRIIVYKEIIDKDKWRGVYKRYTYCSERHYKFSLGIEDENKFNPPSVNNKQSLNNFLLKNE